MTAQIVEASAGTPEDIDLDKIADRIRNSNAGEQVQASAVVYGDGFIGSSAD